MDSSPSSIAGPKDRFRPARKSYPGFGAADLPLPIKIEATGHLASNFAYLLLACLCVLLHPSTGGPQSGWLRVLLLDVPIFLTASLSVAVFYVCAQRELYPRTWMKEILLLPALIALGVGLSINNARAVLEAVFNHHSEFKRTPKYGIENKSKNWRSCRYMPLQIAPVRSSKSALQFTFSYFVWFAVTHGQYFTLPFLSCSSVVSFTWPSVQWRNGGIDLASLSEREVAFPA